MVSSREAPSARAFLRRARLPDAARAACRRRAASRARALRAQAHHFNARGLHKVLVFGASGCEMRIHDCVAAGAGAPDGVVQADPREAWIAHYQYVRARDRAPRAVDARARARSGSQNL